MSEDSKKKRPREYFFGKEESSVLLFVDRFLDMDTDEIASSGRHDDVILCRLEEFVGKLDASVKKVRDVREKEKNATIELEEKRKREADVEAEYKCMYENKICFDCKIIMNDLKECVCLSSDSFHGYSNVLSICEGCFEKRKDAGLQICAECNNILCDNCDSFKCGREGGGCGNVVCYPCVDSNYNATECEACGNWFCKSFRWFAQRVKVIMKLIRSVGTKKTGRLGVVNMGMRQAVVDNLCAMNVFVKHIAVILLDFAMTANMSMHVNVEHAILTCDPGGNNMTSSLSGSGA